MISSADNGFESKYSTKYIISRLLANHIKPYKDKVLTAAFFMVIVAAANAIIVYMTKPMVDDVLIKGDQLMLRLVPLMILGVFLIKGAAEYWQSYLVKSTGQKILTDIQLLMYEHLLKADLALIQTQSSGRLISRFTNDISLMRGAVSNLLIGCAKYLLSVIFLIGTMFYVEPKLTIVTFIAFPIAIYPAQQLGRKMRKIAHTTQEELGNYTAQLDQTFQSIKVVKSYIAESFEVMRGKIMMEKICELYKKAAKFDALTSPMMEILNGCAVAGIIMYGGMQVLEGKTTTGSLFTFLAAFISAYRPYKSLVSLNVDLQEGLAASKRLFQILDTKPHVYDSPHASALELNNPEIIFENVSLKFGTKQALNDINLSIPAGKTTAIVGQSGGGKTSIANLLVRFYEPSSGKISISGHNIQDMTLKSLRNQIVLITQDTMLFDSTIFDNIAYSKEGASKEEVIEASKAAAAHDFIMELSQGYDTHIGSQGLILSGGQRQRLSIARAFLKDAPILIMDEATSSLDTASERIIQKALQQLTKGRTTIIITHRLHAVESSDQIIVMKNGSIMEIGTHDELINKGVEYKRLYLKDND